MGGKAKTDTPERPRHAPHRLEASSGPPGHRTKPPAASQLSVSSSARPSLPPLGPPARHRMPAQQRLQPPTKPPCHQLAPQTATGECASLKGPIGPLDTTYTAPHRCCGTAPHQSLPPSRPSSGAHSPPTWCRPFWWWCRPAWVALLAVAPARPSASVQVPASEPPAPSAGRGGRTHRLVRLVPSPASRPSRRWLASPYDQSVRMAVL